MSRSLPARPDLAHLKKQAKALVRAGTAPRLADAQLLVAREYGFASWTKLKRHIESLSEDPVGALISAVKANDVAGASNVIERHPELRVRLNDALPGLSFGATILHPAVQSNSRAMVDLLLRAGADINAKSDWWAGGFGALDLCALDFAPFLIERGAVVTAYAASRLGRVDDLARLVRDDPGLVHSRWGDGHTPLHVAATVEVARILIDNGADINALDVDHESTPAQYAVRDRQDVARYLLTCGAHTDILMAAALGDLALVQRFLDEDSASITVGVSNEHFPMRNARAGGTIYIWTLGWNKTAHAVAREFGRDDVLQLLMRRTSNSLKLALACEFGDRSAVRAMLAAQPDLAMALTADERRRVDLAARDNNTVGVELMLEAGWPTDARGSRDASMLHWAAWHGNAEMARTILRYTGSALLKLEDGEFHKTPLEWAFHGSQNGWHRDTGDYVATVNALLNAGASVRDSAEIDAAASVLALVDERRRLDRDSANRGEPDKHSRRAGGL